MNGKRKWLTILLSFAVLSGCSVFSSNNPRVAALNTEGWKESGMIVLSRTAPASLASKPAPVLGFLPMETHHKGHWLAINKEKRSISVMSGDETIVSSSAEGLEHLASGTYEVIHKQRNPLWYAPDTYFSSRLLSLPTAESRDRYRKGALGDFAIYISEDVPLHSAPFWSDEVGGVRLNNKDISRLYYSLDVGSVVEIK